MAVGAIGNAIYVNQQSVSVANTQAAQNSRFDMQNALAMSAINEKDEKVIEVRPTEENEQVDSDREHQREDADQKNRRAKKSSHADENDNEPSNEPLTRLDIKV